MVVGCTEIPFFTVRCIQLFALFCKHITLELFDNTNEMFRFVFAVSLRVLFWFPFFCLFVYLFVHTFVVYVCVCIFVFVSSLLLDDCPQLLFFSLVLSSTQIISDIFFLSPLSNDWITTKLIGKIPIYFVYVFVCFGTRETFVTLFTFSCSLLYKHYIYTKIVKTGSLFTLFKVKMVHNNFHIWNDLFFFFSRLVSLFFTIHKNIFRVVQFKQHFGRMIKTPHNCLSIFICRQKYFSFLFD